LVYPLALAVSNSVEQNPSWEANSRSTGKEISRLLLSANVHFRYHNSPLNKVLRRIISA